MKFIRWDITKPISKNNIIILTKDEINKHKGSKSTNDLILKYGKETFDRIEKNLQKLIQ